MHNLASRHKEERASLEKDKQNLDASIQELLRTAEVRLLNVFSECLWGSILLPAITSCGSLSATVCCGVRPKAVDIVQACPPMQLGSHRSAKSL